jgi:hypothetical protein
MHAVCLYTYVCTCACINTQRVRIACLTRVLHSFRKPSSRSLCKYICICVCIFHMYMYMHTNMMCMYMHMYVCMSVYTYIHTYIHTYIYIYIYIYICVCVCVYTLSEYMCIGAHTQTRTHTYIYMPSSRPLHTFIHLHIRPYMQRYTHDNKEALLTFLAMIQPYIPTYIHIHAHTETQTHDNT